MTTSTSVRTRFAPSPTGHLHVGGARTAIFNWLFARHHGGVFIIRIEDTDQARSTRDSERIVLDDLRWLGLHWDEGPDVGGPHGAYRQSERGEMYAAVAEQLVESGHVYRCFCDEATLEAKRRFAENENRPPHYDLTCFALGEDEVSRRLASGMPHALRFHVPKGPDPAFDADVTIDDLIRGEVTWRAESLGDFIILRSDGTPTYNFCVVVDDHEMEITHVIRAEEHLTNTHRQVLLYRALGWRPPRFAHVSIILGQDRSKLSKRHGATSVAAYADEGYLPDAMLNYLTLLGWAPADGQEIFSRETAVRNFSLDRVNAAAAVFDLQKFSWMNGQYLHGLDSTTMWPLLQPRFVAAGWLQRETDEAVGWFQRATLLVQKSASTLADFVPALALVFEFEADRVIADAEASEALRSEGVEPFIEMVVADLREHGAPRSAEEYQRFVERIKTSSGRKGKALFMPIRVALTGRVHGPELMTLIPLLETGSATPGLARIASPLERAESLLAAVRTGRSER